MSEPTFEQVFGFTPLGFQNLEKDLVISKLAELATPFIASEKESQEIQQKYLESNHGTSKETMLSDHKRLADLAKIRAESLKAFSAARIIANTAGFSTSDQIFNYQTETKKPS